MGTKPKNDSLFLIQGKAGGGGERQATNTKRLVPTRCASNAGGNSAVCNAPQYAQQNKRPSVVVVKWSHTERTPFAAIGTGPCITISNIGPLYVSLCIVFHTIPPYLQFRLHTLEGYPEGRVQLLPRLVNGSWLSQ